MLWILFQYYIISRPIFILINATAMFLILRANYDRPRPELKYSGSVYLSAIPGLGELTTLLCIVAIIWCLWDEG